MDQTPSLVIEQRHLQCFLPSDQVLLRDPRGKSSNPSLLYDSSPNHPVVCARGPFQFRYNYTITRDQGVAFVDITGDPNMIHRDGDVVAGAMTASKITGPLEVLCPQFHVKCVQLKFVGICHYGRRVRSTFQCRPEGAGWHMEVTAWQDDRQVATADVTGVILSEKRHTPVKDRHLNAEGLAAVKTYFRSLGIDSEGYFDRGAFRDYTYPFGYVLSLPTGEIVRQMAGQGGMLNVLKLETLDSEKIPITGSELPAVRLKRTRPKRTFNRILTDIIQGVVPYYKGSVIVNPTIQIAG